MCLRRRTCMRSCNPSRRYNRRTRVRLISQPSRRSKTQIRWYPNRSQAWVKSRIRSRSADRSFARLRRYEEARPNCAKRQARAQPTANVSWNQCASSRRRMGLRLFFTRPPRAYACRARDRPRAVSTGSSLLPPAAAGGVRSRLDARTSFSRCTRWRR